MFFKLSSRLFPGRSGKNRLLSSSTRTNPGASPLGEASQNPSLEYVVMLEIETAMTRTELENALEPDYKILKIRAA